MKIFIIFHEITNNKKPLGTTTEPKFYFWFPSQKMVELNLGFKGILNTVPQ